TPVPAGGQDTAVDRGAGQPVASTRPTNALPTGGDPPGSTTPTPLRRLLAIGAVVLFVVAGLAFWLAARPDGALVADEALAADDGTSLSPSPTVSTPATGTTSPTTTATPTATPRPAEPGPTVEAARFASPPTIDGSAEEWAGHRAYDSNTVIAGRQATVRASWLLGWDTDTYYVHVTVTDPRVRQSHEDQPDQLWKGDSVGFELGVAAPEVRTDVLDPADVHVLMGPTPDGRVVRAINVPVGKAFEPGPPFVGGEVRTLITADGYTIEAAIPWSLLNVTSPKEGLTLATNLNVSDSTSKGGLAVMESNNPRRSGNDAPVRHVWGRLQLDG
ncbi:MAG TPA: hypothetical protein VLA55_10690, partial [Ornithinibacter sp.]|nr:hypothetical protein [Ornithinibacter sp.]